MQNLIDKKSAHGQRDADGVLHHCRRDSPGLAQRHRGRARRGLRLRSDDELLQINLAHALLAQSKDAEARKMYLQFRGRTIEGIPVSHYLKLDCAVLIAAGVLDAKRVEVVLEWLR